MRHLSAPQSLHGLCERHSGRVSASQGRVRRGHSDVASLTGSSAMGVSGWFAGPRTDCSAEWPRSPGATGPTSRRKRIAPSLGMVRHVFTHLTLDLTILSRSEPLGEGWWHPLDRIADAGLPTLYRRAAELALAATETAPRRGLKKPGRARKGRRKSIHRASVENQGNFMDDRFNTIAGWVLFAGIVALGSSIVAGEMFLSERPEKMGYPIAGVEQESSGGAAAEQPIEAYLAKADPAAGQQIFNKCMACHNADKGGAEPARPEPVGRDRRADRAGQGLRLLRCAVEKGRNLELGQSQPVADQPARLRSGHEDDFRRPWQSAGPGQCDRVPEYAQRCAQAAPRRARPPQRQRGKHPAPVRTTVRKRPASSRC